MLFALTIMGALFATSASAFTFEVKDTKVNLGGYVKLDVTYADPGVSGNGTIFRAANSPHEDNDRDGTLDFSARQSRYWIKTSTPTELGTLKSHIEGDFYGSGGTETVSNSYGFRLRHAYGVLDAEKYSVLMGQTWTTFMDLSMLGEIIDFTQHTSTIFARQAQIRYTYKLDHGKLMFALENPENNITTKAGAYVSDGKDNNNMPDIIARWDANGKMWHTSVAVMLRQFKTDNASNDSDDDIGAAFSVNAKLKFANKNDLRLQINGGATGRYMGLLIYPGATMDNDGNLDEYNTYGGSLAFRHVYTPTFRTNVMISATKADPDSDSSLWKETYSGHLNLLWDVLPKVTLGAEVNRTEGKRESGKKHHLTRYQFSARYIF
jgi:hypothetical protein